MIKKISLSLILLLAIVLSFTIVSVLVANNNVAFASSTNGIVENNLIYFSDWDSNTVTYTSGLTQKVIIENDNETIYYLTGVGSSIVNNVFTATNNGSGIMYKFNTDYLVNGNVTLSVYATSVTNVQIRMGSTYNNGVSKQLNDGSVTSLSLTGTYYTNYNVYIRSSGSSASATIHWIKLEYGAEFTGFVKNSYSYHGYDEGYNNGIISDESYDIGYNSGYDTGFDVGYDTGFEDGLNSAFGIASYDRVNTLISDTPYSSSTISVDNKTFNINYHLSNSGTPFNYLNYTSYSNVNNVYTGIQVFDDIEYNFAFEGDFTIPIEGTFTTVGLSELKLCLIDVLDSSNIIYTDFVSYSRMINYYTSNNLYVVRYLCKFNLPSDSKYDVFVLWPQSVIYNSNFVSAFCFGSLLGYLDSNSSTGNSMYQLGYNTGFEDGYSQGVVSNGVTYENGYQDGMTNGKDVWYDTGYHDGLIEGYNNGFEAGNDSNELTFYNLFGAIYDVPISAFNGLLDFEVLGVNLKGFYLGLISLCIILFILKLIFK